MTKDVMILTGAGQIGMAIARRMGTDKKIVIGDKNINNANTIAEIMTNAGFDVDAMETDLSSRESIKKMVAKAQSFGELRKSLTGISQRVLTENLRALENDGLLDRQIFAEVPPRVEYRLNKKGLSLLPIITAMAEWGTKYKNNQLD